uniref:Secreted protein n=1 Tax=Steinernema glaseri TaxID=37863 RepID=A0A1I7Y3M0_9BILA
MRRFAGNAGSYKSGGITRTARHQRHIAPLQFRWQRTDEVHVRGKDMLPADPLQPADDLAHIERRDHAEHTTDQGAHHTDQAALHHERAHYLRRRRADGTQDGDVRALVVHHHDQGGDDVERRHRNDHHQQQADHGLFHLHGTE